MLPCCLRCTLKPSASAIAISKLYQLFRERGLPYGLQDSLPTLSPSCSLPHSSRQLRHGPKARYGWGANPYRNSLLNPSRRGLTPRKMRRALLGAITRCFGARGFLRVPNSILLGLYTSIASGTSYMFSVI